MRRDNSESWQGVGPARLAAMGRGLSFVWRVVGAQGFTRELT